MTHQPVKHQALICLGITLVVLLCMSWIITACKVSSDKIPERREENALFQREPTLDQLMQ